MTSFTVRVELHKADEDDYAKLHEEMEERGFVRRIKDVTGPRIGSRRLNTIWLAQASRALRCARRRKLPRTR